MSEWLQLKRLAFNTLPLPKYETELSAGIDFAACLTRPCIEIRTNDNHASNIEKRRFITTPGISGRSYSESDLCHGHGHQLYIQQQETIMIPLGWKCEFGHNVVLQLHIRSSVGLRGLSLANGTGIIDPDYRGELFACLWNRTNLQIRVDHGQRLVQGVFLGFAQATILETEELDETARGEAGFGSTGVMAEGDLQTASKP